MIVPQGPLREATGTGIKIKKMSHLRVRLKTCATGSTVGGSRYRSIDDKKAQIRACYMKGSVIVPLALRVTKRYNLNML